MNLLQKRVLFRGHDSGFIESFKGFQPFSQRFCDVIMERPTNINATLVKIFESE
jgi:hypothetical protein